MTKLGPTELQIIHLGIKKGGVFDESDIESSELKKLGVGRILDILGELRERELIAIDKRGFLITEKSREFLWGKNIPLDVKLLRLLRIKPYDLDDISKFLILDSTSIEKELDSLRKQGFVLMSPVWRESFLEKTFEILQEGVERLDAIESGKIMDLESRSKSDLISELLKEIQMEIESITEISPEKKRNIFEKIQKMRNSLD